jgi:NAD(P)-dependent dehydrogenase (short-subunit alcohol dehydrogenase family)
VRDLPLQNSTVQHLGGREAMGTTDPAGPVAVVTGGGAGIGAESGRAFAEAGYRVLLVDIDEAAAQETAAALRAAELDVKAQRCDVADPDEVAAVFEAVAREYDRLDALHANAGVEGYFLLEEMVVDVLLRQIAVDLTGALLCARAAIPLLARDGGGSIVFTSSVQGYLTLPGCVPYAAAKAGLMAAARALAVEVGDRGIRVNSVSPGTIDTPMLRRDLAEMNPTQVEDFFDRVRAANALGRVGEAQEVAQVVVFLCSSRASYITGEDVVVDGGYLRVKKF